MSLLQRGSNRDDGYGLVRRLEERQAPPRRSTSLAQMMQAPLKRAGDQYFSPAASTEQRLVYLFTLIVFGVITCIVLISDLITPPCDEALIDAIIPLHDKPFVNPHYNPGCSAVRYLALLGLTPRECDLGRRILFAMCCGGAVGYERRRGDRPAGIRTMALVSLGSCIFTITSILAFEDGPMSWDSSRVAAAIPSGVGFLGAGLIWRATVRQGDTEQLRAGWEPQRGPGDAFVGRDGFASLLRAPRTIHVAAAAATRPSPPR